MKKYSINLFQVEDTKSITHHLCQRVSFAFWPIYQFFLGRGPKEHYTPLMFKYQFGKFLIFLDVFGTLTQISRQLTIIYPVSFTLTFNLSSDISHITRSSQLNARFSLPKLWVNYGSNHSHVFFFSKIYNIQNHFLLLLLGVSCSFSFSFSFF